MNLDANNFENFTKEEYVNNLDRLGIKNHSSLVGELVYYSREIYGEHKVLKWDIDKSEYLLEIDNQKFWTNPFKIKMI